MQGTTGQSRVILKIGPITAFNLSPAVWCYFKNIWQDYYNVEQGKLENGLQQDMKH